MGGRVGGLLKKLVATSFINKGFFHNKKTASDYIRIIIVGLFF